MCLWVYLSCYVAKALKLWEVLCSKFFSDWKLETRTNVKEQKKILFTQENKKIHTDNTMGSLNIQRSSVANHEVPITVSGKFMQVISTLSVKHMIMLLERARIKVRLNADAPWHSNLHFVDQ